MYVGAVLRPRKCGNSRLLRNMVHVDVATSIKGSFGPKALNEPYKPV